jgi:opacity protein-like surface antigen
MKKTIIAVLAASVFATGAAQAAGFDGFYVGADVTANTAKLDVSSPDPAPDKNFSTGEGSRQMGFGIDLGYGKTFGQFYLAGEAVYAINQGQTGTASISGVNVSSKARNVKSISILPGFVVNKDLLIYARLGKGTVDGETTVSFDNVILSSTRGDIDIITKGIGLEYSMNKNVAIRAEFSVSDGDKTFDNGEKETVSANSLAAGFQYRF